MNNSLLIFENSLILSSIVIAVPMILAFCLLFIKKPISQNTYVYLHAFSAGMLVVLATFGLMKEAFEGIEHGMEDAIGHSHSNSEIWIKIGALGGGAILGLIFAIGVKMFIFKLNNKKANKIIGEAHNHHLHDSTCCVVNVEELIKRNGKIFSILIISSHKFIDGMSLGILANNATTILGFENIGTILLFILHDLPIVIIIFFMQKSSNVSNKKSILYIFLLSLIVVPFIFIGGFVGNSAMHNHDIYWLIPMIEMFSGSILLFTTMMEIIPEFIHNQHLCSKHWYITVTWLSIGIALSVILNLIHIH